MFDRDYSQVGRLTTVFTVGQIAHFIKLSFP